MEAIGKYSNTIDKWFDETVKSAGTRLFPDTCFVAILVLAKKYTKACFTLLENDHILPAKALLRILGELFIKLAWCVDIENNNLDDTERVNRLKRWTYHTKEERMNGLKKCLKATENKSEIEFTQQSIREKGNYLKQFPQSIANDKFPSTVSLFTDEKIAGLDSLFGHEFYLKNYFLYNNAVHLDMRSLGSLVKIQNGITSIASDGSDNKEKLAQSGLYQFLFIVLLVRKYYNQEIEGIIAEYDDITKIG